jgi:hypothetical protein
VRERGQELALELIQLLQLGVGGGQLAHLLLQPLD